MLLQDLLQILTNDDATIALYNADAKEAMAIYSRKDRHKATRYADLPVISSKTITAPGGRNVTRITLDIPNDFVIGNVCVHINTDTNAVTFLQDNVTAELSPPEKLQALEKAADLIKSNISKENARLSHYYNGHL